MDIQKDEDFEKAWQENRHIWESTKNLAKAMFYAGQAQAIPDGFVLVNKKDLVKVLNCVTDYWLIDTDSVQEFKKIESLVQGEVNAMIEAAQEQTHD